MGGLNHTALALDILDNLRCQSALVCETHLGREGAVRHPFGAVAWGGLLQHAVDLLEGETLGFGNEEVGVDEAGDAEGAPDEEDFGAKVALVGVHHVGCDDGDDLLRQILVYILHLTKQM